MSRLPIVFRPEIVTEAMERTIDAARFDLEMARILHRFHPIPAKVRRYGRHGRA